MSAYPYGILRRNKSASRENKGAGGKTYEIPKRYKGVGEQNKRANG